MATTINQKPPVRRVNIQSTAVNLDKNPPLSELLELLFELLSLSVFRT